jgi:hypothetical protein
MMENLKVNKEYGIGNEQAGQTANGYLFLIAWFITPAYWGRQMRQPSFVIIALRSNLLS